MHYHKCGQVSNNHQFNLENESNDRSINLENELNDRSQIS